MTKLFLESHDLLPEQKSTTDIYIVVIGEANKAASRVASELREEGLNIELDITNRKIDKQLKTAIKKKIAYMLFVGEDEAKNDIYPLKNVATSEEQKLSIERIVTTLRDRRANDSAKNDEFDISDITS